MLEITARASAEITLKIAAQEPHFNSSGYTFRLLIKRKLTDPDSDAILNKTTDLAVENNYQAKLTINDTDIDPMFSNTNKISAYLLAQLSDGAGNTKPLTEPETKILIHYNAIATRP